VLPSELEVLLLHLLAVGAGLRVPHTASCWWLEGLLNLWSRFSMDQTDQIRAERSRQQWKRPGLCHLTKSEGPGYSTAMHARTKGCKPLTVWSVWSQHLPFDLKWHVCNTLFKLKVQGQSQGNPCPYMQLSRIMDLASQFKGNRSGFLFSY